MTMLLSPRRIGLMRSALRAWRPLTAALVAAVLPAGGLAAAPDFPRAGIVLPTGPAQAELHVAGDSAIILIRLADGSIASARAVNDVSDALGILADRRLAFAWPALLAWAGSDLTLLRERAVARARMAAEAGLLGAEPSGQAEKWAGDPAVSATLHYARALSDAGHKTDAITVLREAIAQTPGDAEHNYARVFLTMRLANMQFESGDVAAGIAQLEAAERDKALDGEYELNIVVNLAMALARSGQYQRALVTINNAWRDFDAGAAESEDYLKVPSSEANFAWIKACALDGLGSHEKARALMAGIVAAPDWPVDDTVPATARLNGFLCMHDDAGFAAEIAAQLQSAAPAGAVFLQAQPGAHEYAPDRAVVTAALHRPALIKAMAGQVRDLAPAFAPALQGWRAAGAQTPALGSSPANGSVR